MSDSIKFTCEECGGQFDTDPDCMLESELAIDHEVEPGEEWKHDGHRPELSPEDRERAKAEMNLTDEQLDKVLSGESVAIGGCCICKPCQDRMQIEQYGPPDSDD